MKLNCGLSPEEKFTARVEQARRDNQEYMRYARQWQPYFAWWPTRVGPKDCRWLETIERQASGIDNYRDRGLDIYLYYVYAWDYRPIDSGNSGIGQAIPAA